MSEKKIGDILFTRKGRIATITMNQPEKRNPLTLAMADNLREALALVAADDNIRAVILTGAGKSFSAGADMKNEVSRLQTMNPHQVELYLKRFYGLFNDIIELEKPLISAVNGFAIATGFDLILTSDFVIAADDARMGDLRVGMGLVPSVGAFYLTRHLGIGRAKAITILGQLLDAPQALDLGLVYQVVPAVELIPAAEALAERLAASAFSIGLVKKMINYAVQTDLDACMKYFVGLECQATQSDDHRAAIKAFIEKRQPEFKGK